MDSFNRIGKTLIEIFTGKILKEDDLNKSIEKIADTFVKGVDKRNVSSVYQEKKESIQELYKAFVNLKASLYELITDSIIKKEFGIKMSKVQKSLDKQIKIVDGLERDF